MRSFRALRKQFWRLGSSRDLCEDILTFMGHSRVGSRKGEVLIQSSIQWKFLEEVEELGRENIIHPVGEAFSAAVQITRIL